MQNITFTFPQDTQFAQDFFNCLKSILAELPNVKEIDNQITLSAIKPEQAFPVTKFCTDTQVRRPMVQFDGDKELLRLLDHSYPGQTRRRVDTQKRDDLGIYYETSFGDEKVQRLPIQELQKRLQGHIVRIDHTGLQLPAKKVSQKEWDDFIGTTASACNIYKYPAGEPWPFILPATQQEFEADIAMYPIGREPKFELVYDTFFEIPTIQIDLETDLEQPEIERLFPAPYGVSWPGLAEYFRTVYIQHEWSGLIIKFDLRYKSTNPGHDWNTGKWLVADGGRLSSSHSA